jgi:hypothetical protein
MQRSLGPQRKRPVGKGKPRGDQLSDIRMMRPPDTACMAETVGAATT